MDWMVIIGSIAGSLVVAMGAVAGALFKSGRWMGEVNSRLTAVESRLDRIEKKVDSLNGRK